MGDGWRVRMMVPFVVTGLIFLGLAVRLVQLSSSSVERVAALNGLEVEQFYQYPPLVQGSSTARPRQVRVPALTGRTFSEAGEALMGTGLLIAGIGDVRGTVVRQDPAPGKAVREGTQVKVWLVR
ncbi:MAG TPA: PASTA domain-containing protein [Symbiobacteriaceae bacterium]|nr:PASTA domain-containing protein [Symbiobacteriaceae bacterium]